MNPALIMLIIVAAIFGAFSAFARHVEKSDKLERKRTKLASPENGYDYATEASVASDTSSHKPKIGNTDLINSGMGSSSATSMQLIGAKQ